MSGAHATAEATAAAVKKVSYLELFFDLVFVFAITQLAGMLHDDHTAAGWAHAGLMAWLVWWAWSQFTWAGNAIDLSSTGVRAAVLAVGGVTLLAAMVIPEAFSTAGEWFGVTYAVVRLAALGLYWHGLRDEPDHRRALLSFLPIAAVSPLLVLAGGFAGQEVRPWLWLGAVAVDVLSVVNAGKGEFRVQPAHFAERHGLFVIIALGESVIAIGATAASGERTAQSSAAVAAAFAIVAALWWAYFDRLAEAMEHALRTEADGRLRGHLARDAYTLAHLPIVVGPVLLAVGVEDALAHPADEMSAFAAWAVAAGVSAVCLGLLVASARAHVRPRPELVLCPVAVVLGTVVLGGALAGWAFVAVVAGIVVAAAGMLHRSLASSP